MLYKSLHHFKASHPSALCFKQGEVFVSVRGGAGGGTEGEEDQNWRFVLSVRGEPGYVPRSYVTRTQLGRGRLTEIQSDNIPIFSNSRRLF